MRTDVRTIVCPLPPHIKAYTAFVNDFYTIVLNENLSYEARYKAYIHELAHINNGDFLKDTEVSTIENEAHGVTA